MKSKKANGEGTVTYDKKAQRWIARFSCVHPTTGEFLRKKFSSLTQSESLRRGRKWLADVKSGMMPENEKMTLAVWLTLWLEDYVKASVRIRTYEKYKSTVNCYLIPHLGSIYLKALTAPKIQAVLNQLLISGGKNNKPLSTITVLNTRRYLIQALEQAYKLKFIRENVAKETKPPRIVKKEINFLNLEQINNLFEVLNKDLLAAKQQDKVLNIFWAQTMKAFIVLAIGAGMRSGELLGLDWSSVEFTKSGCNIIVKRSLISSNHGKVFAETKTNKSRRKIPVSNREKLVLEEYKNWQGWYSNYLGDKYENNNLVFTGLFGKPLDLSRVFKKFQIVLTKSNLPNMRLHDLRHTHASLLICAGVNAKIVQERLGHSTITITLDTYSHLLPGMQDSAVQAIESFKI